MARKYKSKWGWMNEDNGKELSIDYLNEHFEDWRRYELFNDKEGNKFYHQLRNRGWLDILPGSKWSWMNEDNGKELSIDYHNEHFEDMNRLELQEDKEGRNFLQALRRRGLESILYEEE